MHLLKTLMKSPATLSIIAIQVGVYIAQSVDSVVAHRLSLAVDAQDLGERPWSPLTVMFLHELLVHIALMVLMLAAFGTLLEQASRAIDVVTVYLLAGLAGSVAVLAATPALPAAAEEGTIVGASAAVFGVSAAILAMRPSSRVLGGTAPQWLAALVGINIVFLFSLPLGSVAHLVGVAVGWAYGRWLRARPGANAEGS